MKETIAALDATFVPGERQLPANILTFEGGPSGPLVIRLLRCIEQQCPGFLKETQIFAGNSFGTFLAAFLAAHVSDDHDRNHLVLNEAVDYADDLLRVLSPGWGDKLAFLTGLRALSDIGDLAERL